jgi:hypothetical protein
VLDEDVVEGVVVVEDVVNDTVVRVFVVDDDVDVVEVEVVVDDVIKDVVDDNVVLLVVILVEFVEFINKNVGVISTLVAKINFFKNHYLDINNDKYLINYNYPEKIYKYSIHQKRSLFQHFLQFLVSRIQKVSNHFYF